MDKAATPVLTDVHALWDEYIEAKEWWQRAASARYTAHGKWLMAFLAWKRENPESTVTIGGFDPDDGPSDEYRRLRRATRDNTDSSVSP